jgi:hypothetical protein
MTMRVGNGPGEKGRDPRPRAHSARGARDAIWPRGAREPGSRAPRGIAALPPALLAAALAAAVTLAGCAGASIAPAPRPVMVEVPVPTLVYCAAPAPTRPVLAIASLDSDSPPADTVRAYAASVMVLKAAVVERDSILRGCAAPADAAAPSGGIEVGGAGGAGSADGGAASGVLERNVVTPMSEPSRSESSNDSQNGSAPIVSGGGSSQAMPATKSCLLCLPKSWW